MRPFQIGCQLSAKGLFSSPQTYRLAVWPSGRLAVWPSGRLRAIADSPRRRRGWDSNPRRLITSPLFESGTFNHSDTSPTHEVYQCGIPGRRQNGTGDTKTARRVPGGDSEVRLAGFEPAAFGSATQRSIP